jgi:hypothetical protein
LIEGVTVSVAVMVCEPIVFRVALKFPLPPDRVAFAGSTAIGSELVKCTLPIYVAATLFAASRAETPKVKDVPTLAEEVAAREKCVAVALTTFVELDVPVTVAVTVSVAAMVSLPMVFSVAEKVPMPFASIWLKGSAAWLSVLEKWTVPESTGGRGSSRRTRHCYDGQLAERAANGKRTQPPERVPSTLSIHII